MEAEKKRREEEVNRKKEAERKQKREDIYKDNFEDEEDWAVEDPSPVIN